MQDLLWRRRLLQDSTVRDAPAGPASDAATAANARNSSTLDAVGLSDTKCAFSLLPLFLQLSAAGWLACLLTQCLANTSVGAGQSFQMCPSWRKTMHKGMV